MKEIGKRTIFLGAAALCWGIMFPEYTFTTDSYTVFMEDAGEFCTEQEAGGMNQGADEEKEVFPESADELYQAVRNGKVRYRFRLYEYLKNHLFSRSEYKPGANAFLEWSSVQCAGMPELEGSIVDLWNIQSMTDTHRSECLTPESAG